MIVIHNETDKKGDSNDDGGGDDDDDSLKITRNGHLAVFHAQDQMAKLLHYYQWTLAQGRFGFSQEVDNGFDLVISVSGLA